MQPKYAKATVAAVWMLAVSSVGIAASITSIAGLTALTALCLLPPIAMLRLWKEPVQTTSESIREALR